MSTVTPEDGGTIMFKDFICEYSPNSFSRIDSYQLAMYLVIGSNHLVFR